MLTTTATFDVEPVTLAERAKWLHGHDPERHPVIVAAVPPPDESVAESVAESAGESVVGFACLSKWSDRCAYARAAEVSVYVRLDWRGRGIGRLLLGGLIDRARHGPVQVLLSRIVNDGGAASIRLHQAFGFQHIGTMRRVGQKFGRILDVELYDLHLDLPPVGLEES